MSIAIVEVRPGITGYRYRVILISIKHNVALFRAPVGYTGLEWVSVAEELEPPLVSLEV